MEEKSSVFMTLGTALGLLVAIVYFIIQFATSSVSSWMAVIFLAGALIGRVIGYGLDRIVDSSKTKKR
ncbi:hypothetical protein [uncultured Thomasclavelia sp.]|uniref:hypothetical protein n=1 Tax=uncultured Thomasclavelia sp. TaxID=3025759 RepID=UPI0025D35982|nr:hypothetical protein [uncultured Thomasclavelia sp.]